MKLALIASMALLSLALAFGAVYFDVGALGSQFLAWASGIVFSGATLLVLLMLGSSVPQVPAGARHDTSPALYVPVLPEENFYSALQSWMSAHEQYRIEVDADGKIMATMPGSPPALIVFVSGESQEDD